jgi:ABC-type antimicrobial peptide transport system permease subunit
MSSRLVLQILTTLGGLGLVMAVVGLYAVMAYVTTRRTREIGIRMALGAERPRVLLLVLQQAVPMVVAGLLVGIGLAFVVTPAFAVPFDFAPRDGRVLALATLVLIIAALAASLIPAHRAALVNPTVALRDE